MINLANKKPYTPQPSDYEYILEAYSDFIYDRNLKNQAQDMLGGRTLAKFWEDSESDYNVLCETQSPNDPVVPYASGVSRDKANVFISNLALNLFYPTVVAQNSNQEVDRVMSRVSRALLEYAHENDGRPAASGHSKFLDYVHKSVVQGTVHIQDDCVDGRLVSSLVPNEEIYISNYFQPNIQLQPRLMRVTDHITYQEAELEFGELENFRDYVYPGMGTIFSTDNDSGLFKEITQILDTKDKCQVVRRWTPVPARKLAQYKAEGRLPKHVVRAKYFNIIINGVLMFPAENLMPYHDGFYPITKGRFEMFSKPEYYWGNSLPNKIKQDKKWKDGWKTLLRWKAKLSAIPPLITFNGAFVDGDIVIPGMITQAPAGRGKDDIQGIPGLSAGLNNSDQAIMNDADEEINRSTVSPQQEGQVSKGRQTAQEIVLAEANAKKILNGFAMQIMFMTSARAFPILMRMFQFLPKREISKIAVPNQQLPGGKSGTMEVIFINPVEMTAGELDDIEYSIYAEEKAAERRGSYKKMVYVNAEYLKELDLYVKASVEEVLPDNPVIRQAKADMKFQRYSSRPDLFNQKAAARRLVIENGDDEEEMLNNESAQEQPAIQESSGMGSGSGQNPLSKMAEQGNMDINNQAGGPLAVG